MIIADAPKRKFSMYLWTRKDFRNTGKF